MTRISRIVPVFAIGLAVLAGCSEDATFPSDPGLRAPEGGFDASRSPDPVVRPHEADFHRLSQELKSFGGYFYDEQGNLVAYLQDTGEERRARELLQGVLRERQLGQRERITGNILIRRGEYNFMELSGWRDRATDPVLNVRGVEFTDLDEAQNRFVVGVSSRSGRDEAARILREMDVPLSAVLFEETAPAEEFVKLTDYHRPLEGGYQIQNGNGGTCTLGFNAYWSGTRAVLTNSHCTPSFWKPDGVLMYQHTNGTSQNLIGWEAHDPAGWSCGFLWLYTCRWSDAAVVRLNASVPWNYRRIARPTFWATGDGNSGSLTIDSSKPNMTIVGEYSFPKGGEMFDKVGRTTGWTYGFVKKTCVDVNKPGARRAVCQDWIHKMHASFGDSGSPIFRWHGDTVTLSGILWGGIKQGGTQYTLMSAMWNIKKDLGALSTF
jgi:hypothetical protein